MIEDELIKIWQSSSNQERLKFEKSKLMLELKSSLVGLHRWWKYMERVNIVSILITIPVFIFYVYWIPFTSTKIASVLMVFWVIYIGIRTSSIKKIKPSDLEENYLQYLEKTRLYILAQKRLIETSIYWAVLPIYPLMLLFFIGPWEVPKTHYLIIVTYLVAIGIWPYASFLNKKRIKNKINPRLVKIDELIKELKKV